MSTTTTVTLIIAWIIGMACLLTLYKAFQQHAEYRKYAIILAIVITLLLYIATWSASDKNKETDTNTNTSTSQTAYIGDSEFLIINNENPNQITYGWLLVDTETNVMYVYYKECLTVLLNADGTPKLYSPTH